MKHIFPAMILLSLVFALLSGRMGELTNALASQTMEGIRVAISLAGGLCFWSGMMNVAKKSGLAEQIARFMQPLLRRLFRGVQKGDAVLESVSMNLVANLLGLGNAATPLGLRAMQQFQAANPNPSAASHNMIVFVVLNTAAMQLIPTTVATLRMSYGSAHPFEIIPATLLSSACSLMAALLAVKLMGWRDARHAD